MGAPNLQNTNQNDDEPALKMPEEEHEEHVSHDEGPWLISYADLMTLLMGFFALMTSMATFEEEKFAQVGDETAKFFGGKVEQPFEQLGKKLQEVIKEKGIDDKVIVRVKKTEVAMIFEGTLFFDSGSVEIRANAQDTMTKIIQILGQEAAEKRILVEGHTDDVPINQGLIASNWELSSLRAAAVARMFESNQFAREQIITIGYGDTRPFVPQSEGEKAKVANSPGRAQHRRVVLKIMNQHPL